MKLRVTCRDCPCCEHMPDMSIGLCWRWADGPQVIDVTSAGFCGDEPTAGCYDSSLSPRELWMDWHQRTVNDLTAILMLMGRVISP